jgi:hypothetical protein
MITMTYNYFARCKVIYSNKEVIKCLYIIKKSTNARAVDEAKIRLLQQLNQIITKNIDNFFNMIKKDEKEPIHTKDDMVGECYIILQNCILKFDMKKNKYFFWYYNKALTRALIRIREKMYLKHYAVDTLPDYENANDYYFVSMANQEQGLVDYYLENYGLDKQERRIVKSLINGQKLRNFLEKNKDISWNKYYALTASIKKKLEPLKEELKTYTDVKI